LVASQEGLPVAEINALILFADARGITRWANHAEEFARLDRFAVEFSQVLRDAFPAKSFIKGLGDGAMIVRKLPGELDRAGVTALLADTLERITRVGKAFATTCDEFAHSIGHRADLLLGWGIVRGPVQHLREPEEDFVGPNVNKCARLCGIARPFGIVVDQDDFPNLPPSDLKFYEQTRSLTGIAEPVSVWVTKEIATQFLTRESLRHEPEVHVAGQCVEYIRAGKGGRVRILIARRSPARRLYKNLYEGCGGQLAPGETFVDGVRRHFQLEMNIDVHVIEELHRFYEIREAAEPLIPGIRFLCERAGEQEPNSPNHSEVRWVSEKEFSSMPSTEFVPGLQEQVLSLVEEYKRRSRP
jgi:class 3 adenylate cyclase